MSIPPVPAQNSTRTRALQWTTAAFLFIGILWAAYFFFYSRYYEYTDDAYVDGNQVMITAQVPGIVLNFSAYDSDFVEKGRVLIELDKTDAITSLEKAKAELGEAVRTVVQLFENAKRDAAVVNANNAEFIKCAQDYEHRKAVVEEGGVSLEDFEHAKAALSTAFFSLQRSEHSLAGSIAAIENTTIETHPLVEAKKSALKDAFIFLFRCTIKAPVTGIVGQRTVQVGESVPRNKPLLSIIPLDQLWITSNYKEDQLRHIRIGQPVKVTSDTYGSDVVFSGKVEGIGGATGSVYSVLPPQNATGNWIKIVQRVPVRITIDQELVKRFPLRMGLSVESSVDTHNRHGTFIPLPRIPEPLCMTDIFENEEEGVNALISEIIEQNRKGSPHE